MINTEEQIKEMLYDASQFAIGNDVLVLVDFYKMLNPLFINKVYTEAEKNYAYQFKTPSLRFASTFSAKEAVFKAVKQLFPHKTIPFNTIEITRNKPAGKPSCQLLISSLSHLKIAVTISHDGAYVWAIALIRNT